MSQAPTSSSSTRSTTEHAVVPKGLLLPNPWNPNRMTAAMYDKALESIQTFGFIDPLTVRRQGLNFQIIDGEHRFRAGIDLGMYEFPCVIIDVTDAEAKKLTIVLNELHGQADPGKMGDLLADILDLTSLSELKVGLPYDDGVLAGFLNQKLPDLPPLESVPPQAPGASASPRWVERLYKMPPEVALVVDEAIEKAKDGEEIEAWQGLERVAADYLAS